MDLLDAAIARGDNDPHVLIGGYFLLMEEGLEAERPAAHTWFNKAPDTLRGGRTRFSSSTSKTLSRSQTQWNEHTRQINDTVFARRHADDCCQHRSTHHRP
jgi:hypothetical protein